MKEELFKGYVMGLEHARNILTVSEGMEMAKDCVELAIAEAKSEKSGQSDSCDNRD